MYRLTNCRIWNTWILYFSSFTSAIPACASLDCDTSKKSSHCQQFILQIIITGGRWSINKHSFLQAEMASANVFAYLMFAFLTLLVRFRVGCVLFSNSCSLVKCACGNISAKWNCTVSRICCNTFKVKGPVNSPKSAFSITRNRWMWIRPNFIKLVVAYIATVKKTKNKCPLTGTTPYSKTNW